MNSLICHCLAFQEKIYCIRSSIYTEIEREIYCMGKVSISSFSRFV